MAADEFDDGELGSEIDDPPEDLEDAIDELLETDLMGNFSTELANLLYRLREDGAGGGLDGNFEPGEAVVYAGDGEYVSEPIEIDREPVIFESGETDTVDVSDIATTETVVVTGARGGSGGSGDPGESGGNGGPGGEIECRIDFALIDEIEVVVGDGQDGADEGDDGEQGGEGGNQSGGDGGDGGGSSAIYADGELVVEAGGGGGGGGGETLSNNDLPGGSGGTGGGRNGIGGSGGSGGDAIGDDEEEGDDGDAGYYKIYDEDIVTYMNYSEGGSNGQILLFE